MSELPKKYKSVQRDYPEVHKRFEALGEAASNAGPLDAKSAALVKLAFCIAAGLEGGAHSSVRKGLEAGCTPDEMRHVAVLGVTTLGFSTIVRGRAWVEDVLAK